MSYKFNPFTGNFDISAAGSSTSPGGSDTQVQFNDGGSFGGDSGLTFNKTTNALTVGGATVTADAPVLNMSQTWNDAGVTFTGLKFNITDTASNASSLLMDLQVGGSSKFSVRKGADATKGEIIIGPATSNGVRLQTYDAAGTGRLVVLGPDSGSYAPIFGSTVHGITSAGATSFLYVGSNTAPSAYLYPDAANVLAQRNSTNAQTFRLYNTYTDASNYERGKFEWASNVLRIGTEKAGSGSARALEFQVDGTTRLAINTGGAVVANTALYAATGSVYIGWALSSLLTAPSNGVIRLTNNAENDFDRLQFGGTTSSFPALKRSTTLLQARLADDSAYTGIESSLVNVYAAHTSGTNYQRCGIKTAKTTLSNVSGASVTATSLIPAGAFLIGVTSRVNTALGTSNGTTGYQVGTAGDPDLWGAITGTAEGTASGSANYTAVGASGLFTAATNVIVTATGGNFDATGVIELAIHYLLTEAD